MARVLDADLSGDRPYLVMEHIAGDTLLNAVKRDGPLPEVELDPAWRAAWRPPWRSSTPPGSSTAT